MTVDELKKEALDQNNYYDFSNGVNADDYVDSFIQRCIKHAVADLRAHPDYEKTFQTSATGNRMVVVEAYREGNKVSFHISVVKSYERYHALNVEL
jgi:hypothetical protein